MSERGERRAALDRMTIFEVARIAKGYGIDSTGKCFDDLVNAILEAERAAVRVDADPAKFDLVALLWADVA
jgi:hypothetical protein